MNEPILNPSPAAKLFKARREELGLTQTELAEKVSDSLGSGQRLSQQTYASFERGKTQSSKHEMQIAAALGILDNYMSIKRMGAYAAQIVDLSEALVKHPELFHHPVENELEVLGPPSVWDDDTPLEDDEVEVPLYKEVELSAGDGRTMMDTSTRARLRIGKLTLRRQGIDPSNVVCMKVSGNSMEPVLPDNSTVGVDRGKTSLKDGELYAFIQRSHLRIKQLFRLPSGGIRVRSFNRDDHPDEEYSPEQVHEQEIEILGRVFWWSVLR
ncbi:S24 family peptidase [Pseudomonas tohonis]|nr:repressor [Pseudomonas alcaligenes OT 69]MDN4148719.1 S24 family peptidase [Pseudomonas tohonis]